MSLWQTLKVNVGSYKHIVFVCMAFCIWFLYENWVFDIVILWVLIAFLVKIFIGLFKGVGLFNKILPLLVTSLAVIVISLDERACYKKCKESFSYMLATEQCRFAEGEDVKIKRLTEKSFLFKEYGLGSVCQIHVTIGDRVRIKNPILGHELYSSKNCNFI